MMRLFRPRKRPLFLLTLLALLLFGMPAWADRYIVLGESGLRNKGLSAKSAVESAGYEVLESYTHLDGAVAELSDAEVSSLTSGGNVKAIPADLPLYPAVELSDGNGHGTWVTGIVAGDHTGVCPYVTVIPFKIADSHGDSYSEWIVKAADQLIGLAQNELAGKNIVVNFSYSTRASLSSSNEYRTLFEEIFDDLDTQGRILFVSASGNDGDDLDRYYAYPADVQRDMHCSTAAHDEDFELGTNSFGKIFSNYGGNTVDVAAPGSDMYTTDNGGGYVSEDGTSFSSPFVSAVAAYVWAEDPELTASQVKARLGTLVTGTASLEVIAGSPMAPDNAVSFADGGSVPTDLSAASRAWHLDDVEGLRGHPDSFDFSNVVCVVWDTGVDENHADLTSHLFMDQAYDATGALEDDSEDPIDEDPDDPIAEDPEDPDDGDADFTPGGGGGCGIGQDIFPWLALLLLPFFLLSKH